MVTRKECVEQSRRISGKTSTSQLGRSTSRTKRKFTPFMVHQTPVILNLQCRIMFLFFTLALSFPADSQTQWSDQEDSEEGAVASDYEDEEEEAAASESECSVPFDRREMDNKQTMDKFWKSKKQEWEL